MTLKKKKLLLFFTFNTSLNDWKNSGILAREISYYVNLSKSNRYKIYFLTYGSHIDMNIAIDKSINIIPIFNDANKPNNKLLILIKSLIFIFKNNKLLTQFDIYKTNQNFGSWLAVLSKIFYRKKLISRSGYDLFHFAILEKRIIKIFFSYLICSFVYNFSNNIIVPSEYYKYFLSKYFFIKKSKINIIPNFVNTKKFNIKNDKKYHNRVIFIGRLEKQKNLKKIINIFTDCNYFLDIYGDGSMKNDLLKYSLHKKSNVSFFDRINNDKIPDLLNKYNYLILFSLYEGNPKILLEAMSCGLCIIGSKVPGIKDIIINNQNGLIFDLDDRRTIINKISTISKNNLLLIQNNARKTIEKNFALDLTYKIELNILNSLFKN